MPPKEEGGVVAHSLKGPTITHYTEVQTADESGESVLVSQDGPSPKNVSRQVSQSLVHQ